MGENIKDLSVLVPYKLNEKFVVMESRTRRTRLRSIVGICLFLALTGIVYLGYFCPDHVCALTNRDIKESIRISEGLASLSTEINNAGSIPSHRPFKSSSTFDYVFPNHTSKFDLNAHDVIVFLHIQKTGEYFSPPIDTRKFHG